MIWNLLTKNKYLPIALDMGADSIKMLQFQKVDQTVRVSACARWKCPPRDAQDPARWRKSAVAAVRELLRKNGFRGRNAVTALSCSEMNIKSVRIPHAGAEPSIDAVRQEAMDRFNFDPARDQLHCLCAGSVRSGSETRDEVILGRVAWLKTTLGKGIFEGIKVVITLILAWAAWHFTGWKP